VNVGVDFWNIAHHANGPTPIYRPYPRRLTVKWSAKTYAGTEWQLIRRPSLLLLTSSKVRTV
jgi:hypothetical protein